MNVLALTSNVALALEGAWLLALACAALILATREAALYILAAIGACSVLGKANRPIGWAFVLIGALFLVQLA